MRRVQEAVGTGTPQFPRDPHIDRFRMHARPNRRAVLDRHREDLGQERQVGNELAATDLTDPRRRPDVHCRRVEPPTRLR